MTEVIDRNLVIPSNVAIKEDEDFHYIAKVRGTFVLSDLISYIYNNISRYSFYIDDYTLYVIDELYMDIITLGTIEVRSGLEEFKIARETQRFLIEFLKPSYVELSYDIDDYGYPKIVNKHSEGLDSFTIEKRNWGIRILY